ncbi:hypothetical protein [Hymenobacter wooponensis]|uniref:Uncharacterized protein n=1 Tax=Hymenobacter wooponensis TaxID=1525360 RepID=A0A4Z0MEV6_9BACT|nr:hypothetical protein [Hymenobacter wooponensis]TGD77900.1 hypothetical protein EU557_21650 [Hymenobacter wooponensis]
MCYCYLLLLAGLVLSGSALAQTAAPPSAPTSDSVTYALAPPRSAPAPDLPWWLPNAQECAAIRAEENSSAPRAAQRRTRTLRRWAQEQPEPQRRP